MRVELYNQQTDLQAIYNIHFDSVQDYDEVLALEGDNSITYSMLNPLLLAVHQRSMQCIKEIIQRFGLRTSLPRNWEYRIRFPNENQPHVFHQLLLPILLKIKDNEILSFLLKQEGFMLTF